MQCDAQSAPAGQGCSPCLRSGHECLLDPLSDKRRSVSRKYVDHLQQRIETLEALTQRPADHPAPISRPTQGLEDTTDGALTSNAIVPSSASREPSTLADSLGTSNDTTTATDANKQSRDSLTSDSDRGSLRPLSEGAYSPQEGVPIDAFDFETGTPPDSHSNKSPSFYGATSHPHVFSPGDENHWPDVGEEDEVGISLDPASPHLRDKLLQTFFKYQTLWVDVVRKEAFVAGQAADQPSLWYSKLLEYAMLACASRLSTSRSVRALGPKLFGLATEEVTCHVGAHAC
ncbi:unnamed protein product [Clonostachys rosea]|uniref:Transcription factor domain-containing protein n=1 Tax=Bionectria ochroleuca TaxID=29856 RepID=A0ABY6TZJ9_BIOOC|nr:unnamed protein product [Clonostachys rosea]